MRRVGLVFVTGLGCPAASAHDAFGDVGPFYNALLHPLADPVQGLAFIALATLLGRLPLTTVRLAIGLALASCVVGMGGVLLMDTAPPSPWLFASIALICGMAAIGPSRMGGLLALAAAGALGLLHGLSLELVAGSAELSVLGTLTGAFAFVLLLWALFDWLCRAIGTIACQVAGSWAFAIALLILLLPGASQTPPPG